MTITIGAFNTIVLILLVDYAVSMALLGLGL